jgi:hypothetical protein
VSIVVRPLRSKQMRGAGILHKIVAGCTHAEALDLADGRPSFTTKLNEK